MRPSGEHDISIDRLEEFHQIYNVGTFGDKDELVQFRDERVKGQGHGQTKYGGVTTVPFEFCLVSYVLYFGQ